MRDFSEAELNVLKNAKRILKKHAQTRRRAFTEPAHIRSYLQCDNAVREAQTLREEFRVMYLDTQHRLIKDEILFAGTIDASPVYPRVVVQRALENNAGAVIFAHNHPSGVPEPSTADRNITKRLQDALAIVDIKVLDHFVIGDENIVSFAERGLL